MERLVLENPRSLEFLQFIDTSNVLMDVAPVGATFANQDVPQWNSQVDTTSNDPRQYGDGRGEVIPSFDGADFRQYERRVRLFVSSTQVAPERRAGKLVERLEGRAFDSCEGIQELGQAARCRGFA